MNPAKFFSLISFFLLICACDNKANTSEREFNVISVNEFPFFYNDTEQGGLINFQSSEFEQCTLTFILTNFVQYYQNESSNAETGDLDLTCLNNEDLFTLNDRDNTYAQIKVNELNDKATITLDFAIAAFNSDKIVIKKDIVLTVNAEQLKILFSN